MAASERLAAVDDQEIASGGSTGRSASAPEWAMIRAAPEIWMKKGIVTNAKPDASERVVEREREARASTRSSERGPSRALQKHPRPSSGLRRATRSAAVRTACARLQRTNDGSPQRDVGRALAQHAQ